jgi:hypothetical protein
MHLAYHNMWRCCCKQQNLPSRNEDGRQLTGGQGFEPQLMDPESTVLPIKLSPKARKIVSQSCRLSNVYFEVKKSEVKCSLNVQIQAWFFLCVRAIMPSMMRDHLSQFEDRIQYLIEGGFARLFAGRLHPRELATQLVKSMEDLASRTPDGQLVAPDTYSIRLSPRDHAAILEAHPDIITSLTKELVEIARIAGITLTSTPKVKLLADDNIGLHQVAVSAWHMTNGMDSTQSMRPGKVWDTNKPDFARALLILNGKQQIVIDRPVINLGRNRDNHVIFNDPAVSRHHAQIRLRFGQHVLFDLGSTSGTLVNSCQIQETTLQSGDVITLGASNLIYIEEDNNSNVLSAPLPSTEE